MGRLNGESQPRAIDRVGTAYQLESAYFVRFALRGQACGAVVAREPGGYQSAEARIFRLREQYYLKLQR
jgi:hypothetical protein